MSRGKPIEATQKKTNLPVIELITGRSSTRVSSKADALLAAGEFERGDARTPVEGTVGPMGSLGAATELWPKAAAGSSARAITNTNNPIVNRRNMVLLPILVKVDCDDLPGSGRFNTEVGNN